MPLSSSFCEATFDCFIAAHDCLMPCLKVNSGEQESADMFGRWYVLACTTSVATFVCLVGTSGLSRTKSVLVVQHQSSLEILVACGYPSIHHAAITELLAHLGRGQWTNKWLCPFLTTLVPSLEITRKPQNQQGTVWWSFAPPKHYFGYSSPVQSRDTHSYTFSEQTISCTSSLMTPTCLLFSDFYGFNCPWHICTVGVWYPPSLLFYYMLLVVIEPLCYYNS